MRSVTKPAREIPRLPLGTVSFESCPTTGENREEENKCKVFLSQLNKEIEMTEVFSPKEPEGATSDFTITLLELPDRSIYYGLGHDPISFLFSSVIPFWQTSEYGFQFSIRNNRNAAEYKIDSREKGTLVFWSLAPLFNIFPGRIWERRQTDESKDLRNRIINSLETY
jgi:hypothetical protein